jgi:protease I
MAGNLQGRRIAILVAMEGIEQVELTEPRKALDEAGATTELLSTEQGQAQSWSTAVW